MRFETHKCPLMEKAESLSEIREARQWVLGFEDSQSSLGNARTIGTFCSVVNRKVIAAKGVLLSALFSCANIKFTFGGNLKDGQQVFQDRRPRRIRQSDLRLEGQTGDRFQAQ